MGSKTLRVAVAKISVVAVPVGYHTQAPKISSALAEFSAFVAIVTRLIKQKPGATVIDVGVSRTADGIQGDVDFDAVEGIAGAITPMPGGTGPMTIACLLENTLEAARLQGAVAR